MTYPSRSSRHVGAVEEDSGWPWIYWLGLRAPSAGDHGSRLRATEIGGYNPLIWKNLGTAQAQLAATQPPMRVRAGSSVARAVAAGPNNPEAHAGAAHIFLVLADNDTTMREAQAAVTLRPDESAYLELLASA